MTDPSPPVIDFDLTCSQCGGGLRGTAANETCPGCDRAVTWSIDFDALDPDGRQVAKDAACVSCGYNLRGLSPGGRCPECAHPIVASIRPTDLLLGDPDCLRRVRRGVRQLIFALVMPFGAILVTLLPFGIRRSEWDLLTLAVLVIVGSIVVGAINATTLEPVPRAPPVSRAARVSARIFVAIFLSALLLKMFGPAPNHLPWAFFRRAGFCVGCGAMGLACVVFCLRPLALRANRANLSRLMTQMFYVGVFLACVTVAWAMLLGRGWRIGMGIVGPSIPVTILRTAVNILWPCFYFLTLVALFQYNSLLTDALNRIVAPLPTVKRP